MRRVGQGKRGNPAAERVNTQRVRRAFPTAGLSNASWQLKFGLRLGGEKRKAKKKMEKKRVRKVERKKRALVRAATGDETAGGLTVCTVAGASLA